MSSRTRSLQTVLLVVLAGFLLAAQTGCGGSDTPPVTTPGPTTPAAQTGVRFDNSALGNPGGDAGTFNRVDIFDFATGLHVAGSPSFPSTPAGGQYFVALPPGNYLATVYQGAGYVRVYQPGHQATNPPSCSFAVSQGNVTIISCIY